MLLLFGVIQLCAVQAILGATNPNPGNGFAGAALFLSGASAMDITALPGLLKLTDINGTIIIQSTGLVDLSTGLQVCLNASKAEMRGDIMSNTLS